MTKKSVLDAQDLALLRILQKEGRATNASLAESVNMSESACLRRIKQLEANCVIQHYAAVINPSAIGLPLSVVVTVTLTSQSEAVLSTFENAVRAIPQIFECHLMTGAADYVLRAAVSDAEELERLHRVKLTRLPGVARINSSIIMRSVVQRQPLPLAPISF